VLQLEIERLLKAAGSEMTMNRARELVKTMYALTYTKPGNEAIEGHATHGSGAAGTVPAGRKLGESQLG